MAAVRVILSILLFGTSVVQHVGAAACAGTEGKMDDDGACTSMEAPRAGGVMLQTAAGAKERKGTGTFTKEDGEESAAATMDKTKLGPLSARLDTIEAEVISLQQRVSTMETQVVGPGGLAAVQAAGSDDVHTSASLLAEAQRLRQAPDSTIKDRTVAAEANVSALKSQLSTLENQVRGADASLIEVKTGTAGSSLTARIENLEHDVDSCRTRTSNLEHMVVG